jgi:hypothetical protein
VSKVTDVVQVSKASLREFSFKSMGHCFESKERYDCIHLLDVLVSTESLVDLSFESVDLSGRGAPLHQPNPRNTSITRVQLTKCNVGDSAFALLSECVALTTLALHGCSGLPCYESWKVILQGMQGLRTVHVTSRCAWDGYHTSNNTFVQAIADATPACEELELHMNDSQFYADDGKALPPWIQELEYNRSGSLKLQLRYTEAQVLEAAFDGIRLSATLTTLKLSLSFLTLPAHFASFALYALASNVSLRSADLVLRVPKAQFDPSSLGVPLTAMIRGNTKMELLAFRIEFCHMYPWDSQYSESLLPALINGLEHNRTLDTIHFGENDFNPVSPTASRALVRVLKRRGVRLKTIKGLSYESAEDERAIEYLCATRYARLLLESCADLPPGLMPYILSKLSLDGPDSVRYFLKNMPRHERNRLLPVRGTRRAHGTVSGGVKKLPRNTLTEWALNATHDYTRYGWWRLFT